MNRRERKKLLTRNGLLDAALKQFTKQGLYTTRIEDITESADVGKGAFYNYFSSKTDLIAELLHHVTDRFDKEHLAYARDLPFGAARIQYIVRGHQTLWKEHPEFALLFHQARGLLLLESEATSALRDAFKAHLERIASLLVGEHGTMKASPEKALQKAAALVGLISGHFSFACAADLPIDQEMTIQVAVRGFAECEGIEPTSPKNFVSETTPSRP